MVSRGQSDALMLEGGSQTEGKICLLPLKVDLTDYDLAPVITELRTNPFIPFVLHDCGKSLQKVQYWLHFSLGLALRIPVATFPAE